MAERKDPLDILARAPLPQASPAKRQAALDAALSAFAENSSPTPQGSARRSRLTDRLSEGWKTIMRTKLIAAPALAGLIALPVAGFVAVQMTGSNSPAVEQAPLNATPEPALAEQAQEAPVLAAPPPPPAPAPGMLTRSMAPAAQLDQAMLPTENSRDRFQSFDTNPIHRTAEDPVSTFSLDVDTASYSFTRRSLREGLLPEPGTVRVEEMINYFPYDWQGPASLDEGFRAGVSVMPTPWNPETRLMHVAIKGYSIAPAAKPRANLVFLLDVSGSMNEPDKLPLLKSAFRLLLDRLGPEDTVSVVTYAGEAGTVLEPTKASERGRILDALDGLQASGGTAGAEGITQAYRLAERSFVEGGVNRVMLATDGDFNLGQTDDASLERLVEEKRAKNIFLSVFGFGRGNLNDQTMQTLAQNGNGTAAYIDTLGEAEKVLVQEAGTTLFPIASDVKIQVEFNPATVSEYRLIGYETRALKREDFNNERVDAGEVGSGASVTAIYEVTPAGAPQSVDALRYEKPAATTAAPSDELAFLRMRWKSPDGRENRLLERPVTVADALPTFDAASEDQRFSVAVAAFGQKLRDTDQLASMTWDRIAAIAAGARGADPFGYRAEFLSLVRLAGSLDPARR